MKMGTVLVMLILASILLLSGCASTGNNAGNAPKTADGKIICADPPCLGQYFPSCTPAEVTMSSEEQTVTVTIHGFENEKCHFTMSFGNITAANCYFKKEDLNSLVLGQMFGNKEGQDTIVAEACGQSQ